MSLSCVAHGSINTLGSSAALCIYLTVSSSTFFFVSFLVLSIFYFVIVQQFVAVCIFCMTLPTVYVVKRSFSVIVYIYPVCVLVHVPPCLCVGVRLTRDRLAVLWDAYVVISATHLDPS